MASTNSFSEKYHWLSKRNLICNNDRSDKLISNPKLYAHDNSHFSIAENVNSTPTDINNGFINISKWVDKWNININSDPTNQSNCQ